jgi:excinuclease ABC subunit A
MMAMEPIAGTFCRNPRSPRPVRGILVWGVGAKRKDVKNDGHNDGHRPTLQDAIKILGARQHNLKNIEVEIPRGKLVVITGPSGSGKSSLAFHTLYAEGQRRYVESLSVYARQFLDQLEKPDVDAIEGLSPAIAIEQRGGGLNPRSTVATATEIYDYLRVLWAAAGIPHDPVTGERLERMSPADIVETLAALEEGTKVVLLAPVPREELGEPERLLGDLQRQGFIRVRVDGEVLEIEEAAAAWPEFPAAVEIVVDRFVVRPGVESRLADSVETALRLCGVEARAAVQEPGADAWRDLAFQTSYRNPRTGFVVAELSPKHFSFNSHFGACEACEGLGKELVCDPELIAEGEDPEMVLKRYLEARSEITRRKLAKFMTHRRCRVCLGKRLKPEWLAVKIAGGKKCRVSSDQWAGKKEVEGTAKAQRSRKGAQREEEALERTKRGGAEAGEMGAEIDSSSTIHDPQSTIGAEGSWLGIQDFCALGVAEAMEWIAGISFEPATAAICQRLADDVRKRLAFLTEVGLDYLTLDRTSGTLSGGEAQRIRLATQLGAGLSGVIYVLDEPSIGLHAADTARLIGALTRLRDLGNTVVVVEHDEEIIRAADWLIDIGPGAGATGGYLLGAGVPEEVDSPTGEWLRGKRGRVGECRVIRDQGEEKNDEGKGPGGWNPPPRVGELVIRGAREHNLRNLDVAIPLGQLVALTGPSGSGKSTLADDILRRALARHFNGSGETPGAHDSIEGLDLIEKCVVADQSPIGRSPRSNPATFTGLFDLVRDLFTKLKLSKQRGYGPGRFSFNAAGGRCERCQGNGRLKIEMHFLPDAWVPCPACGGKRFNRETLEVTYKGKSIADVLELSVSEAREFFRPIPKIHRILETLEELGLGYLQLGQPANTLSGGEAQRLKLAVELAKPQAPHTFYLFDEPTTGLHFGDVEKLLTAFIKLRDAGHSVLVVEHHLDVIAAADWVVELGPGGGRHGGWLVVEGTPEKVRNTMDSPTGRALASRA